MRIFAAIKKWFEPRTRGQAIRPAARLHYPRLSGRVVDIDSPEFKKGVLDTVRDAQLRKRMANALPASLKTFADSILIYQIDGDEEHVWLKFGEVNIAVHKAASAEGIALLKMADARRAAIAKATGVA